MSTLRGRRASGLPGLRRRVRTSLLRRCVSLLALAALLVGLLVAAPGGRAAAQTGAVTLTLLSQPAWNSPTRPLTITLRVVDGTSQPLSGLSFTVTIFSPARSRTLYQESLTADLPSLYVLAAPIVTEAGTIPPGGARTFTIRQPLGAIPTLDADGLYPIRVQLFSAQTPDVALATLRTPMIFLADRQKLPLNLTTTWELDEPLQYGPDGVFEPGPIERDIAPGGRIDAMVTALRNDTAPADVVVSPILVDELQRMAAGFRVRSASGAISEVARGTGAALDASRVLAGLRAVAARSNVELVALPFADAPLPALASSGLSRSIPTLLSRGRDALTAALGGRWSTTVLRPPGSALDGPSLQRVWRAGARVVLADPTLVTPPVSGPTGSLLPIARVAAGPAGVAVVVPDQQLQAVVDAAGPSEPALAAHAALGMLAATYFEFPGEGGRGAAMLFPEAGAASLAFFRTMAALVDASPWLRPLTATKLASAVDTRGTQHLPPRRWPKFPSSYVRSILTASEALAQFGEAVDAPPSIERVAQTRLLMAQGAAALADPAVGVALVDAVTHTIRHIYSRISAVSTPVTLTSLTGRIFVPVHNATGYKVHIRLRLVTNQRLTFVKGSNLYITLPPGDKTFFFQVRTETTGRFPITVQILTQAKYNATLIAQSQMTVRATAYNRVALVLTLGAALFLLAWWGRRFLPRRKAGPAQE